MEVKMKINNGIISELGTYATFTLDLIPNGRLRRPGTIMKPKYITVHNTGVPNVKADNFRRSQLDVTQDKKVSWHFTVDENEIIQHLPLDEVGWHAGDRTGNYNSFGIEICERPGAEEVAIKFIAELLKTLNWDTTHVKTHRYWSGKDCPRLILPHLTQFMQKIADLTMQDKALVDAVNLLYKYYIITTPRVWSNEKDMKMDYVPGLIHKMGGLDRLVKDKVITNADIWKGKMYKPTHVRSLIIKYATTLK